MAQLRRELRELEVKGANSTVQLTLEGYFKRGGLKRRLKKEGGGGKRGVEGGKRGGKRSGHSFYSETSL
jgi:hypothetical protein